MNGAHGTDSGWDDELAGADGPAAPGAGFMHPCQVAGDAGLTRAQKRAILAAWASDRHAVAGAPALRRLDNGAVVRIDDVLGALRSLDAGADRLRPLARLRGRLRSALRRSRRDDGDDDPPPCPAGVGGPVGGPAGGGASVALAA